MACLTLPHFSTLSHKRQDIQKKLLNIKCMLWFSLQLFFETFPTLKRIQRHRAVHSIINVHRSSCKVTVSLVKVQRNLYLSKDFRKIPRYQIWWKSFQWVASCSTQTDGQTGRHMWRRKQSIAAILRKRLNRIM